MSTYCTQTMFNKIWNNYELLLITDILAQYLSNLYDRKKSWTYKLSLIHKVKELEKLHIGTLLNYFRCGHIDIFKIIYSTINRKKGNLIRKRDVALLGKLPVILFFIDTFRKHTTTIYWIVYTMTQLEVFKEHNVFSNIQTVNGFNLNVSTLLKYLSKYAHCMMIEPTRNHSIKYHNSFFHILILDFMRKPIHW